MNLATYKKFKGDRLMPWGKATVVTGAQGYVFLAGTRPRLRITIP